MPVFNGPPHLTEAKSVGRISIALIWMDLLQCCKLAQGLKH